MSDGDGEEGSKEGIMMGQCRLKTLPSMTILTLQQSYFVNLSLSSLSLPLHSHILGRVFREDQD